MKKITSYVPHILLCLYLVEFVICAVAPYSRDVWWAENLPIVGIVIFLVVLYIRGIRFSNLGYVMASVLIFWHTIGGHYTFERVPFQFITDMFGWERNNFDRIGHFSVGFYAFLFLEYVIKNNSITSKTIAYISAFSFIGTIAAVYEVVEWVYAVQEGGEAGVSFLGSQGDIWDAQKDMLMDMSGAFFACCVYYSNHALGIFGKGFNTLQYSMYAL
jgi:putative membrane protein